MAKGRGKKQGIAAKLGAPDHFSGFKLAFLVSKVTLYQQAMDSNVKSTAVAGFYDKVTVEFIAKYGRDEPFNKEPAEDPPDPEDGVNDPAREPLSEEEAAENTAIFIKLRTKLAQWYRRKYKRIEATKSNAISANPYLAVLAANIEKAPRKLTPFHRYLKEYYQSRVKEEFLRRYEFAKNKYDNATEEERKGENMKEPVALQLRMEVSREFWLLETQEFRDMVVQDTEDAHAKEVEEWEASKLVPKTPQQFHQQIAFAAQYLYPVAEAIASQMQAAVSICVIGPIADRNGEVEVRSVHVNWPGGIQNATWPLHDPAGYSDAEKSMAAYGRENFSAAECQRRALPMQTQGVNDVDQMDIDCTVEQEVPSSWSHMASPPRRMASSPPLLDPPRGGLPQLLSAAQPAPPSVIITSSEGESNVAHSPRTSIPIDPVLLALSHPQVAKPLPQPEPQGESPHSANPESGSEAPTIRESDPVLPPPASISPPVFDFSSMEPQVPTSNPVVTRPPIPSDWPNHMVDAYRYLAEETVGINGETVMRNWGDMWLGCLDAFIDFQQSQGFPDVGPSFSPSKRPQEIAIWMKNGRRWQDVELADEERFGQRWWDWWRSLQPKSRIPNGRNHLIPPTSDMDWSYLQKPGKNGFLLIMITLTWWGKASTREGSWLEAIIEVTEVLLCMHRASGGPKVPKANTLSSTADAANPVTPKQGRRGGGAPAGRPLKKRKVGRAGSR